MSVFFVVAAAAASAAGAVLLLVAAWGVVILPDALSRQHAATKAGTLALAFLLVGAGLGATVVAPGGDWTLRLLLLFGLLLVNLPVASHLLARAALEESDGITDEERENLPLL